MAGGVSPDTSSGIQGNPFLPANFSPIPGAVNPLLGAIGPSSAPSAPEPTTPAAVTKEGVSDGFAGFFRDIGVQVGDASAKISAAYSAGQQAQAQSAQASQAQSAAILAASQAKATVTGGEAVQQAKQEAKVADEASRLGLTGPAFDKDLANTRSLADQVDKLNQQRIKASSVGFFQDPWQHILNRAIIVPALNEKIGATVQALKDTQTSTEAKMSKLSAGSQAEAAIDSVYTTQRAASLSQAAIQQGIADAQEPLTKQAQIDISALGLQTSAQGEIIKAAETTAGLPLKEAMAGSYTESKEAQIAYRAAQTTEILQKSTDQNFLNNTANAGLAAFGLPQVSDPSKLPTFQRGALSRLGMSALLGGGGSDTNPIITLRTLAGAMIPPAALPGAQTQTVADINNMEATLRAEATTSGLKGKDVEAYIAETGNINRLYQNRQALIQDTGQDKLFSPEPLTSLRARPWAATNPVLQAMAPLTIDAAGRPLSNVPTRYQDIFSTAATLVGTGKITAAQASNYIGDIGRNSMADNDKAYGFKRFAIPINEDHHIVSLPRVGAAASVFGGNDGVDIFSQSARLQYLKKIILSSEVSSASTGILMRAK